MSGFEVVSLWRNHYREDYRLEPDPLVSEMFGGVPDEKVQFVRVDQLVERLEKLAADWEESATAAGEMRVKAMSDGDFNGAAIHGEADFYLRKCAAALKANLTDLKEVENPNE